MSAKEQLLRRLADLRYFDAQNLAQEREIYKQLGEQLKREARAQVPACVVKEALQIQEVKP